MILSLQEIIDIVIITLALGYIFSGMFDRYRKISVPEGENEEYDPIAHIQKKRSFGMGMFDWESLKFAMIITAPAVILHEFGHKFVAMAFGATATFHAADLFGIPYGGVLLGVVLKLMNTGFIFFIPAFVSHTPVSNMGDILIAFAGPAVNQLLWIVPMLIMKMNLIKDAKTSRKMGPIMHLTTINRFHSCLL
ncbi:MAG: hypothetical protein NT001_01805 [Candidatus Woesearchaeota archaeon]|nr:hypothetical protein [Candidatus Woesearchaeota archaeon]